VSVFTFAESSQFLCSTYSYGKSSLIIEAKRIATFNTIAHQGATCNCVANSVLIAVSSILLNRELEHMTEMNDIMRGSAAALSAAARYSADSSNTSHTRYVVSA
jgi:hypothetical protein